MGTAVEEDGLLSDWLLYVYLFMDNSAESNPESEQVQVGSGHHPDQPNRAQLGPVRFKQKRTDQEDDHRLTNRT